ncbi:FAD:protein FMN transferase [Clostridia bacterium]|nr:FAD:protein FMN transferase [Clostridia bacterium]
MKKRTPPLFLPLLLILCLISLSSCQGNFSRNTDSPITKTGFFFDTVIQITIYDRSQETLLDDCMDMAAKYEHLFSRTVTDSDTYRINQAKGSPVTVSADTINILQIAANYSRLSGGAFDLSIGAVSSLWDFKSGKGILPNPEDVARATETVSSLQIHILGDSVTLDNPDAQLDLGAIAKGYVADRMKDYLLSKGLSEGIINLGGNVLALGAKKDGSAYRIGIQKPFAPEGTSMLVVEVTDQTVVTSGVYERYFEKDGVIYHHILDPKTGYPISNDLLAVTIICPLSVDGDCLSTTCFALGLEKGMELIESLPDTEAIFVKTDESLEFSSGTQKQLSEIER